MVLKNKTALVTGATEGIGKAIAHALINQGINLIAHYHKNKKAATALAKSAYKAGLNCLTVQADFLNNDSIVQMFDQLKGKVSRIDILVNNVGSGKDNKIDPWNHESWLNVFQKNLFSAVECTKQTLKIMEQGKILNISSTYGFLGYGPKGLVSYAAAKAALSSYTLNLAKQLAPEILVNAIAPGYVLTPSWGNMNEEEIKLQGKYKLINRIIEPEEVARLAINILENDAICGSIFKIDGGMDLKALNF